MMSMLRASSILIAVFTLLTGLLYPLSITALSRLLFPAKAAGSLLWRNGKVVGSELIGQHFTSPAYFWGRPSATRPGPYDGRASASSHLGPNDPALARRVRERMRLLADADSGNKAAAPVDLVTASASGLDPHISVASALYQLPRVARARGVPEDLLRACVDRYTEERNLLVPGEPRVNVLLLNLALDDMRKERRGP
ncbi:MAG: potassium-transporting ATPase subunit KdpC [Bacteroidota bacterium]